MPAFIPLTVEVQEDAVVKGAVNTLNFTTNVDVSVTDNVATVSVTGGGSPLLPTTGTGTATGAVVGDLATNNLTISNGGAIDETANSFVRTADIHTFNNGANENGKITDSESFIRGFNGTDNGNYGLVRGEANVGDAAAKIEANFNDDTKKALIIAFADATTATITHTADTHTFNNGANENGKITDAESFVRGFNSTGDGNYGLIRGEANTTECAAKMEANFNGDVKVAEVRAFADATTSTITHTADTHTFISEGATNGEISLGASRIRAFNSQDDGNEGKFETTADETSVALNIRASFNDNVKLARITLDADASTSIITHTADQHTINGLLDVNGATDIVGNSTVTGTLTMTGAVKTSANNTDDIGDSTNSFKDVYARTVKLDGATSGTVTVNSDALSNALNTTTLSGTGYGGGTMFSRLTGNFTMSDVNTVQPVFGTGQDVWTLQGATTYRMKGQYYLTHGAVSHSVGMSFELSGGASVTSCVYSVLAWVTAAGTVTATQATTLVNVATNTAINFAGANAQEVITFEGWLTMNAGGTVIVMKLLLVLSISLSLP